jgi:hypothetical protein
MLQAAHIHAVDIDLQLVSNHAIRHNGAKRDSSKIWRFNHGFPGRSVDRCPLHSMLLEIHRGCQLRDECSVFHDGGEVYSLYVPQSVEVLRAGICVGRALFRGIIREVSSPSRQPTSYCHAQLSLS